MAEKVRDVMTRPPTVLPEDATVLEAARAMRNEDIGDVLVERGGSLAGIVTDRDIVVRVVADEARPEQTTLGEFASEAVVTVTPEDAVDEAVRLMREHALRRLPVLERGRPVGIVSLGDLAVERDPDSPLADISAAPPNE